MEKNLMETWSTLESKPLFNNEEDSTAFITWEENYQDLSGWCMDPFQGHCTLPAGESKTTKISGMKIEDTDKSIETKGGVKDLGPTPERAFISTAEKMPLNNNQTVLLLDDKQELIGGTIDVPETWLDLPQSSIALQTNEWIQLVDNNEVNEPLQRVSKVEKIETKYADQQDNWDVIKTLDNTDSDDFDLLSYLCDDNMQSPESISTDSTDPLQASTSLKSSEHKSAVTMRLRSNRRFTNKSETITSSTITSSELLENEEKPISSRTSTRSTRGVNLKVKKDMKIAHRGKKREYESDSDQSDVSYRESRKKNNEASRKSRMNKKAKELEMMSKAVILEKDNRILKLKVEEMEKMVTTLRAAILKSALKKKF
ncbi:uncharacterized protein [Chelonus insularis]|uniref:uncharacterized protein n=1 Tax=Chelonus insularis TaxID=460826 RepID=UPI001588DD27|nr:uncharacterized protein LOC118073479 [Chelonus insularis]